MTLEEDVEAARSLLTVCKIAQIWLEPIAYNSITLAHPRAMLRFAKTMTVNPALGQHMRSLWIGPVSAHKIAQFAKPCTSACKAERERVSYPFARALHRILSRCRSLVHLAIIHCPLVSISQWTHVEQALPPYLQTLVMGPDHAMLGSPTLFPSLKHLISIETTLVHVELANITAFPALNTLEWLFIPHSGTMKLEYSEPGKFGEKLLALLHSPTIRQVKVVSLHEHQEMNDCSADNSTNWTLGMGMGMPRRSQCMTANNVQGHRVNLEFERRSCAGKYTSDWISHLFDEWKKSVVTLSSLSLDSRI